MTSFAALPRQPTPAPSSGRTSSATGNPSPPTRSTSGFAHWLRPFSAGERKKGDRIALIAENRWEWAVTDFAALAIGAVDVPIYPTLTGEQIAALVRRRRLPHRRRLHPPAVRQAERRPRPNPARAHRDHGSAALPKAPSPSAELMAGADERGTERDPGLRRAGRAPSSPRIWPR